ncbi:MAG TPA: hypothetical protein DCO70_10845 [Verrucomicrobiales bacterium]|nr:hypothetical protein [Verrucomicrobiales bacterium]MEE2614703.1 TIR domain-containing protein [Verrucomicrobiota bacterium]HAH99826.1 hypothetical protein [Verrucomicrobiales bacterium]
MNDIFISYAHIDNEALTEEDKGWISQFHKVLDTRVAQLTGEKPLIWRDLKLGGNDVFDQAIVHQFRNARIMISIMSPRYLKSEWCMKELKQFYDNASSTGGVSFANKSRILKVVKTPFETSDIPDEIRNVFASILGFEFFEADPETGKFMEYNASFGAEAKHNYFSKIFDLAHEVSQLLKAMNDQESGNGTPTVKATDNKKIFLATTTTDLQSERDRIYRNLIERGYQIFPDQPMPLVGAEFKVAVREHLEKCDASIHLIGSSYGMVPEGEDNSVIDIQNSIAADTTTTRTLHRFIWMPRDQIVTEPRQASFIDELRNSPRTYESSDFLEDSFENLKSLVLDHLKNEPKPASLEEKTTAISGEIKTSSVYLIYPPDDEESAAPIEDYLFDKGLEVVAPEIEGTESQIAEAHRQNLNNCDAVIIYFGSANRSWVNMKLLNVLQSPGHGRRSPFEHKLVLIAPPEHRHKERYRTHQAEVLHVSDTSQLDSLEPFINSILNA